MIKSVISKVPHTEEHVVICGGVETIYLIPAVVFENIANGTKDVSEIDEWESILPIIISEWLSHVRGA